MERHGGYYHPAAARPPPNYYYYYGRREQHRPPAPAFLVVLMLPAFLLVLHSLAGAFSPPPPHALRFEPARDSVRPPLFPILSLVLLLVAAQLYVPNRRQAGAVALVLALIIASYLL